MGLNTKHAKIHSRSQGQPTGTQNSSQGEKDEQWDSDGKV